MQVSNVDVQVVYAAHARSLVRQREVLIWRLHARHLITVRFWAVLLAARLRMILDLVSVGALANRGLTRENLLQLLCQLSFFLARVVMLLRRHFVAVLARQAVR